MILKNDKILACFVNSEERPLSYKHVCWSVTKSIDNDRPVYILHEVVEEVYPHPECPEEATIRRMNTHIRKIVPESDGAELAVLYAAQQTCSKLMHSLEQYPNALCERG